MQKQSFQRFPIRYRPYDFPSRFPVLAFLGDNWTISVNSPEYLHFHNGLEIGHCISGNGQLFLAGQAPVPYEAEAFSILFPQVPHLAVRGLQESRWEYIYIDPKHFLESASDCGSDTWQIFYMLQEVPVIVTAASFPLLYHYLSRIFREFQEKEPLYQQAVHGLLFSLFSEINRITMSAADSVMSESGDSYSYIRSALSYLYAHYNEPFSVSGLAEHCCISESHLRRLFKNMVGISPLEYLQHYRIQQACHLIHLNQMPVSVIAQQVGYSSLSSLTGSSSSICICRLQSGKRSIWLMRRPMRCALMMTTVPATFSRYRYKPGRHGICLRMRQGRAGGRGKGVLCKSWLDRALR